MNYQERAKKILKNAFTFVGHSQTMKADQKAASIIHEFLKDKYGRLVLYDRMVYFWKLINNMK